MAPRRWISSTGMVHSTRIDRSCDRRGRDLDAIAEGWGRSSQTTRGRSATSRRTSPFSGDKKHRNARRGRLSFVRSSSAVDLLFRPNAILSGDRTTFCGRYPSGLSTSVRTWIWGVWGLFRVHRPMEPDGSGFERDFERRGTAREPGSKGKGDVHVVPTRRAWTDVKMDDNALADAANGATPVVEGPKPTRARSRCAPSVPRS